MEGEAKAQCALRGPQHGSLSTLSSGNTLPNDPSMGLGFVQTWERPAFSRSWPIPLIGGKLWSHIFRTCIWPPEFYTVLLFYPFTRLLFALESCLPHIPVLFISCFSLIDLAVESLLALIFDDCVPFLTDLPCGFWSISCSDFQYLLNQ